MRGTWGEVQLRRVLEHAGMLARCDFDEQVSAVSSHDRGIRPDVVVRLPGDKCLVVDAKSPMTAFLAAQADGIGAAERDRLLSAHATSLRSHVDALAAKAYWSAFTTTPEMVVCFVPGDSILAAAVSAEPGPVRPRDVPQGGPGLPRHPAGAAAHGGVHVAAGRAHQQRPPAARARQHLYSRLATLGGHATKMGASLQKSVESYNALVGALESRVLVTARKMHDLELVESVIPEVRPIEQGPRPLTAAELLEALDAEVARPQLHLEDDAGRDGGSPRTDATRHSA